ncbi:MAG TPA: hypothetical protein VF892_09875 [Pseudonocardiaceae bacterium]
MGEVTDIVNSGVALIHLLANHAGVQTVAGGYANGFPVGYDGNGAIGGSFKQIAKQWKQTSEWYDFLTADFDFTVGVSWLWGIHTNGHGHYVDQITATLEVRYLPIDFTVDVQANFPTHGNKFGTEDDVIAGMPLTMTITLEGVFGQAVSFRQQKNVVVMGDGNYDWPT